MAEHSCHSRSCFNTFAAWRQQRSKTNRGPHSCTTQASKRVTTWLGLGRWHAFSQPERNIHLKGVPGARNYKPRFDLSVRAVIVRDGPEIPIKSN